VVRPITLQPGHPALLEFSDLAAISTAKSELSRTGNAKLQQAGSLRERSVAKPAIHPTQLRSMPWGQRSFHTHDSSN
jgi:hypothetical protein